MKKRKVKNRIKPKKNYILRIAVVAFFIFILVTIVDQQIKIQQSRTELENVNNKLEMAQMKTLDLEKKSQLAEQASKLTVSEVANPVEESSSNEESSQNENLVQASSQPEKKKQTTAENKTDEEKEFEEYLRQEALRLGYAKSGVRVFQNIAGN